MDYRHIVQRSIDYIEENLKTELSADELAELAGFSLFHYYRIFQQFTRMPVIQYIIRRRLAHAIYEIQCGKKIIDVALDYGFDTHAGFYKAFQREYDCSPTEYLRRAPARQPQKINLWQEDHIMMTHARLKEVIKNWDIEQPATISDIFLEGSNLKADNAWTVNDRFVIKTGTNIGSMKRQFALSKAIKDAGLEAACPIPTRDGKEYILEYEHYFFLSPKLYGSRLKSGECFTGDYKANARYLGECIGQLHKILKKCDNEMTLNEVNLYDDVLKWALQGTREQMQQHGCPLPETFYDDYTNSISNDTWGRF